MLLVIGGVIWLRRLRATHVFLVPFVAAWAPPVPRRWWWSWIVALGGLVLLTIALARPQRWHQKVLPPVEGCDIMLAVDVSLSMATEDFAYHGRPINRLQVVVPIVTAFIQHRPNDRIGLVLFSGRAYTLARPTLDHAWLTRQLSRLRVGIGGEGTAIGDALMVALRRLEEAKPPPGGQSPAKFIVLLTDGANNSGVFQPSEAIRVAQQRGVTIHTIATDTHGLVRIPMEDDRGQVTMKLMPSDIDDEALWGIAHATGGEYYRAEWRSMLLDAFAQIDRAQRVAYEPRIVQWRQELFPWFAIPGVMLLGLAAAAMHSPWRRWVTA